MSTADLKVEGGVTGIEKKVLGVKSRGIIEVIYDWNVKYLREETSTGFSYTTLVSATRSTNLHLSELLNYL